MSHKTWISNFLNHSCLIWIAAIIGSLFLIRNRYTNDAQIVPLNKVVNTYESLFFQQLRIQY